MNKEKTKNYIIQALLYGIIFFGFDFLFCHFFGVEETWQGSAVKALVFGLVMPLVMNWGYYRNKKDK